MTTYKIPNSFTALENADANEVNSNFLAAAAVVNGKLQNDNVSATAEIAESKVERPKERFKAGLLGDQVFTFTRAIRTAIAIIPEHVYWDTGGMYNHTSGRFSPTTSGWYRISGQIAVTAGSTYTYPPTVILFKNGVQHAILTDGYTKIANAGTDLAQTDQLPVGVVVTSAVGGSDYFDIRIAGGPMGSDAGVPVTLKGAGTTDTPPSCYWEAEYIGGLR